MRSKIVFLIIFLYGATSGLAWSADMQALKKAAESGDAKAQYEYAEELSWNWGKMDPDGFMWYGKSAAQGYPYAIAALAQNRIARAESESKEEKELQAKYCPQIEKVAPLLAQDSTPEGKYNYANLLTLNACIPADREKADRLLAEAAEAGHAGAQMQLATSYGNKKENEKYISLLKKAADSGMILAMCRLAALYMAGKKIKRDPAEAQKYIDMALATGSPAARLFLGSAYAFGKFGFPQEKERGRIYLEEAAAAGVAKAQKVLEKLNQK